MFTDGRSKKVIFLAHCLLNQNDISDGTAVYPAAFRELCCLGLDRGDVYGAERPVVVENTRIRRAMEEDGPRQRREALADRSRSIRSTAFKSWASWGLTAPPTAGWRPPPTRTGSLP